MSSVECPQSVDETTKTAIHEFKSKFMCDPDIGACAPGRVNLIGEHTDYSDGFVFPMALPMVTVVVGKKTSTGLCRVLSVSEHVKPDNYCEFPFPTTEKPLEPGSPAWANYVKGVVTHYAGEVCGFDAVIASSVPLGGGVSSSAALEVSMYTFLEALEGKTSEEMTKILMCQKAEHTFAGMPCGIMDQFISVKGKKDHALLLDCRSCQGKLVPLTDPTVHVVIINSNVKHDLGSSEYPLRRQQCEAAASAMGKEKLRDVTLEELEAQSSSLDKVVYRRGHHVITENTRCEEAALALETGDYLKCGTLMVESHNSLRDDFEVSCSELDQLVTLAMQVEGVYGSRMTGGGFGGCTVSLVRADAVQKLVEHVAAGYSGKATFFDVSPGAGARQISL